jgi:hypothetical protein
MSEHPSPIGHAANSLQALQLFHINHLKPLAQLVDI